MGLLNIQVSAWGLRVAAGKMEEVLAPLREAVRQQVNCYRIFGILILVYPIPAVKNKYESPHSQLSAAE